MKNLIKIFTKILQILNKSELFDNNASIFNSKIKDNMKRRWWYKELSICRWIRRARQMYFAICRDSLYVNEACCVSGNTARQKHWPTKHSVYVFTFLIYRHQQIFYIEMNNRMHYFVVYKNLFKEIDKYLQKYTKIVWKFNRNVILDWNG